VSHHDTMTGLNESSIPDTAWRLARGQVRRLPAQAGERWLQATAGRLWLTRSGAGTAREADIWLDAGQRQWLAPRSEWVIEGWGDAAFVLLQPPPVCQAA